MFSWATLHPRSPPLSSPDRLPHVLGSSILWITKFGLFSAQNSPGGCSFGHLHRFGEMRSGAVFFLVQMQKCMHKNATDFSVGGMRGIRTGPRGSHSHQDAGSVPSMALSSSPNFLQLNHPRKSESYRILASRQPCDLGQVFLIRSAEFLQHLLCAGGCAGPAEPPMNKILSLPPGFEADERFPQQLGTMPSGPKSSGHTVLGGT